LFFFFFSSRRRHTRYWRDWSSDVALPIWLIQPEPRPGIHYLYLWKIFCSLWWPKTAPYVWCWRQLDIDQQKVSCIILCIIVSCWLHLISIHHRLKISWLCHITNTYLEVKLMSSPSATRRQICIWMTICSLEV